MDGVGFRCRGEEWPSEELNRSIDLITISSDEEGLSFVQEGCGRRRARWVGPGERLDKVGGMQVVARMLYL